MNATTLDLVIVGAGQAGLAASYLAKKHGISHMVFERGRIAESWQRQRWDSFTLNTARKLNLLPGQHLNQRDPDGFATAPEFAASLSTYANDNSLPVQENSAVISISKDDADDHFEVIIERHGTRKAYYAAQVVIASGMQNQSKIPKIAAKISPAILQMHAGEYRNPESLPEGGVLIVGSAQSGCQIADELSTAGREVYLSTSMVPRVPRRYRGKDIMDWLMSMRFFDEPVAKASNEALSMKAPQLTGINNGTKTLSLQGLAKQGVKIIGRLKNTSGNILYFDNDAQRNARFADQFSSMVKSMIDDLIISQQLNAQTRNEDAADIPETEFSWLADQTIVNARVAGISSIIWTTGFTGDFSYIKLPVLSSEGMPVHSNGSSPIPGLYFLGIPWLRKRASGLIYGAADDAAHIIEQVSFHQFASADGIQHLH